MSQLKKEKIRHSPTLDTILMVENVLKKNKDSIKIAELKRKLPKQVNHNTLMIIFEYLEESKKILMTIKGINWVHE